MVVEYCSAAVGDCHQLHLAAALGAADRRLFDRFQSGLLGQGDVDYAAQRMELVAELDVLAFSEDVEDLIRAYHHRLGLVGSATADLPHLAYAVAYNMDYLLTWNCKHIANGQVIRRLNVVNDELGRSTPVIVTPEELLEALPGDDE